MDFNDTMKQLQKFSIIWAFQYLFFAFSQISYTWFRKVPEGLCATDSYVQRIWHFLGIKCKRAP